MVLSFSFLSSTNIGCNPQTLLQIHYSDTIHALLPQIHIEGFNETLISLRNRCFITGRWWWSHKKKPKGKMCLEDASEKSYILQFVDWANSFWISKSQKLWSPFFKTETQWIDKNKSQYIPTVYTQDRGTTGWICIWKGLAN